MEDLVVQLGMKKKQTRKVLVLVYLCGVDSRWWLNIKVITGRQLSFSFATFALGRKHNFAIYILCNDYFLLTKLVVVYVCVKDQVGGG